MSTLVELRGDEVRVTPEGNDIVSVFRPGVVGYERWRAIADGKIVERGTRIISTPRYFHPDDEVPDEVMDIVRMCFRRG